jgi:hypothetical protein
MTPRQELLSLIDAFEAARKVYHEQRVRYPSKETSARVAQLDWCIEKAQEKLALPAFAERQEQLAGEGWRIDP